VKLYAALFSIFSFAGAQALADSQFTAYFSNDSVNGFQLSDAYETHNMGIVYEKSGYYAKLDLGVVSPDMYVYRNQFREANRSFGELVTLEVGQTDINTGNLSLYGRVRLSSEFGIDEMQDFAHKVLSLQPVNEVNDLVRMPEDTWFGVGARFGTDVNVPIIGASTLSYDGYLGTDTTRITADLSQNVTRKNFDIGYGAGVHLVAYDEVVSAPPISASERNVIPYARVGINFEVLEYDIYVQEVISMPTISSDDSLYAVLDAGISFKF
jgi:hypothetical protein